MSPFSHRCNNPARVCLLPISGPVGLDSLAASIGNVLNFRTYRLLRIFAQMEVVGVKPCQNRAEHSLDYVLSVVHMLREKGATALVCDTTDRYRDVKRNAIRRMEELATALDDPHTPIVILDGIRGEHELARRRESGDAEVFLAGETPSLDGAVVVSCVQADALAGLSGAVVNLGVGFSSKRGKIRHFAMRPPHVQQDKCYACRRCFRECPTGAIWLDGNHAAIDARRCINCGRCVEIARYGGIGYQWDATPEHFRTVCAAHARAAYDALKRRVVCMNVVHLPGVDNTTPTAILFSRDPVAVDEATLSMLRQAGMLDRDAAGRAHDLLAEAMACGLGQRDYKLETVAF